VDTGTAIVNLKAERAFISGTMDYSILPAFFLYYQSTFFTHPSSRWATINHAVRRQWCWCSYFVLGKLKPGLFPELLLCYDANIRFLIGPPSSDCSLIGCPEKSSQEVFRAFRPSQSKSEEHEESAEEEEEDLGAGSGSMKGGRSGDLSREHGSDEQEQWAWAGARSRDHDWKECGEGAGTIAESRSKEHGSDEEQEQGAWRDQEQGAESGKKSGEHKREEQERGIGGGSRSGEQEWGA
jgi:hypothetical protein